MQTVSQDLIKLLQDQANTEYQSSLLYLHFAYWFDNHDFQGIGTFFKKESDEERKHSIQILDFLNVRGYKVNVNPAQMAYTNEKVEFEKPFELFQAYKDREEGNFTTLNKIAQLALRTEAVEPLTHSFINRMLSDQAHSCDEVQKIYAKAQAYCALPGLFFHLDHELKTSSQNFDTWKQ